MPLDNIEAAVSVACNSETAREFMELDSGRLLRRINNMLQSSPEASFLVSSGLGGYLSSDERIPLIGSLSDENRVHKQIKIS